MTKAWVITAPDGSKGVWSTKGFRRVPAPATDDAATAELVAMGFPLEDVEPLVAEARANGVEDIRRYVMRALIR